MLMVNQLSLKLFQAYTSELHHTSTITMVALQAYMADVKVLVTIAVNKECTDEGFSIANFSNFKSWLTSLHKWLSCLHPLSYRDRAFKYLLCSIILNPKDHCNRLPNLSEEKLIIRDFSLHIISITWPNNPLVVGAPLISLALSTTVFCITTTYMLKYAPQDSPRAADSFMQDVFSGAANHLHINYVPWHAANAGAWGCCSRRPMHTSWVNLDKALEKQPMSQRNAHSLVSTESSLHANCTSAISKFNQRFRHSLEGILSNISNPSVNMQKLESYHYPETFPNALYACPSYAQ